MRWRPTTWRRPNDGVEVGCAMSGEDDDLFGKIDALRGKRAPDALLEKPLQIEDFPLLTEVIDSVPDALSGEERRSRERRQGDRRQAQAVGAATPPVEPMIDVALTSAVQAELVRLVSAMEARLEETFIRQQVRLEEALRRAVREEIRRFRAQSERAGADGDAPPV